VGFLFQNSIFPDIKTSDTQRHQTIAGHSLAQAAVYEKTAAPVKKRMAGNYYLMVKPPRAG
jgi:hypothetical protein